MNPLYLLLLVLLIWFWRTGGPRWQRALRCVAAGLVVAAMSGLQVISGEAPLSVAFVVDMSDSVAAARSEVVGRLERLVAALRPEDRASVVVFGASPVVERALGAPADVPVTFSADVRSTGTDIEAALRLARATLPVGTPRGLSSEPAAGSHRIVLISDGRETRGNARREASLAATEGVAIDVAAVAAGTGRGGVVTRLAAPSHVKTGEPFTLIATAQGTPGLEGELFISTEAGELIHQTVRFSSTGYAAARHVVQERSAGAHVYRAGFRIPDDFAGDGEVATAGAVVVVAGDPRVLYLGDRAGPVIGAIDPTFAVDRKPVALAPASAAALESYDAVVVDDVDADALTAAQIAALTHHVESRGAGLFVLGSADSLDARLQPDKGLGDLLPIDVRLRSGIRAPEAALVLVFDKSGSMDDRVGGVAKIEFAREGVRRVLEALPSTDALGVIAFDSRPTAIAPLQSGHDLDVMSERLRAIVPGGSTAIAPAVAIAARWLHQPAFAAYQRRHILLVSDGRSSAADLRELSTIVRGAGVRFSAVALGDGPERRVLGELSDATGGRAYFPGTIQELPGLVAREAARVAGGRFVEEPFVARRSAHPILAALDATPIGSLGGYVVSTLKPGAEHVLRSHRDDPVLAAWRYGLGRVAVYTADFHGQWSARVRTAPSFSGIVTGTLQWVARSADDAAFYLDFDITNDQVVLRTEVMAGSGGYVSGLDAGASVRTPAGALVHVPLAESAPGRYEAVVPVADAGAYVVSVTGRSRDGGFERQILRGFYWPADAELRPGAADLGLLRDVAATSGGRILDDGRAPFTERTRSYQELRSWLLGAALIVFVGEVAGPGLLALVVRPRRREGSRPRQVAA